jgi:lipoprotein Spr
MTREQYYKPLLCLRGGFSFFVLLFSLWLIGCGSSSPRFAGNENTKKDTKKTKKGNVRFSSKVVEEETKEDDKKVDVKKVGERFTSVKHSTKTASPKKETKETSVPKKSDITTSGSFEQQKMMDAILAWLGTPYELGGETKSGIDCSAFSREIFKTSAGISLPRTTEQQMKLGTSVSQENLKFGDLIFFNTTGQNPSHVGIYIGDDMFAHASVSFGVTLSSLYSSYYKKRYTEARKIIQ